MKKGQNVSFVGCEEKFKRLVLTIRVGPLHFLRSGWGRSSVGRAPEWHSGGQGFEPPRLHHPSFLPPLAIKISCQPESNPGNRVCIVRLTMPIPAICSILEFRIVSSLYDKPVGVG